MSEMGPALLRSVSLLSQSEPDTQNWHCVTFFNMGPVIRHTRSVFNGYGEGAPQRRVCVCVCVVLTKHHCLQCRTAKIDEYGCGAV